MLGDLFFPLSLRGALTFYIAIPGLCHEELILLLLVTEILLQIPDQTSQLRLLRLFLCDVVAVRVLCLRHRQHNGILVFWTVGK